MFFNQANVKIEVKLEEVSGRPVVPTQSQLQSSFMLLSPVKFHLSPRLTADRYLGNLFQSLILFREIKTTSKSMLLC